MVLKIWRLVTLILVALFMGLEFAHALELPANFFLTFVGFSALVVAILIDVPERDKLQNKRFGERI